MKLLKILSFLFLAVAMFRFMRQMWVTVEVRKASPAQLIASAKTIVPPEGHPAPTPTTAPLPPAAAVATSASNSPVPVASPVAAGVAPLSRGPLQAATVKPKATPFLDKDGRPRKLATP